MAKKLADLKPEEKDDILNYLGFEDFENFKDQFPQKFLTVDSAVTNETVIQKVTGKRLGEIAGKLHKVAKFLNPEISLDKFNEKKIEENIPEIEALLQTKFTELQEHAKSGNDKKLNDALTQLAEKDKSINSYKELAEKEAAERERVTNEFQTGMKSYKINHQFEQFKSKLAWIDDPTDVQRIGFDTKIGSSYKFDLDEKENLIVLDKEGKPIPSKVNGGKMADPLEILDAELEANKLKKLNNANNKNSGIFTTAKPELPSNGREFNPDYLKRVQQLQK